MARIRTIKPSFFTSHSNADLPVATRLTYIGLWTYCDDSGRGVDDARLVKAAIWPLDDNYTARKVEKDLTYLATAGKILRYEVNGRRYLSVVDWEHQKISHPTKSNLPDPPEPSGVALEDSGAAPEDDGEIPLGIRNKEGNKESSSSSESVASGSGTTPEDEGRILEAARLVGTYRFPTTPPDVKFPQAWRRTVTENVLGEDDGKLRRLASEHPYEDASYLAKRFLTQPSPYPTYEPPTEAGPVLSAVELGPLRSKLHQGKSA